MILKKKLDNFEKKINFQYKNQLNLLNSLIHPSYLKNKKLKNDILFESHFERLEFLGDRVLGLSISSLIFEKFNTLNEGDLTKKLSYLVQKEFLYKVAMELNLDKIVMFSSKKDNTRMNKAILTDSVESLIGGMFIDSGYKKSLLFVKRIWGPYLDIEASNKQDSKTNLQEICQQKYKTLPKYILIKKEGPPHSPFFTVKLEILDLDIIYATGKSKRDAEKNAATKALKVINE